MAGPSQHFLATHPQFAAAHKAGTARQFLESHPTVAAEWHRDQAWQATPHPAAAAAPAAAPAPAAPAPGLEQGGSSGIDWVDQLYSTFSENGLGALAGTLADLVKTGHTGPALSLALQDTDAYRTRFAANEARKKAGLPVLSPAEYLATEGQYRQVMQQAGLPAGFYDDPADFTKFLSNDTSPAEIKGRVDDAVTLAKKTDPGYRQMMADSLGVGMTDGDIAAYFLDPTRALPLLDKQVNAVNVSDAARRQGLSYSQGRSMALTEAGVTSAQADQAFGQIADATASEGRAASAFGLQYTQTDAENELLLGTASAKRAREQVEGAFKSYNSGASTTAKGGNAKDSTGSY